MFGGSQYWGTVVEPPREKDGGLSEGLGDGDGGGCFSLPFSFFFLLKFRIPHLKKTAPACPSLLLMLSVAPGSDLHHPAEGL